MWYAGKGWEEWNQSSSTDGSTTPTVIPSPSDLRVEFAASISRPPIPSKRRGSVVVLVESVCARAWYLRGTLEIDGRVRPRESEIWWNKGERKKKKKIILSLKERERVGSGTRPFTVVLMIPKIVPAEKGINSSVSYRSSLWIGPFVLYYGWLCISDIFLADSSAYVQLSPFKWRSSPLNELQQWIS